MQSSATFINDEWKSFSQLAWLDPRTTSGSWRIAKDFAGLPAWICKTVGGTTTHWAGASLRLQEHEFRVRTTYGEIANRLGLPPGASRAVGAANGANPIPIVLPCHRVIGSDGTLTGYAGGVERKAMLLRLEGVASEADQASLF